MISYQKIINMMVKLYQKASLNYINFNDLIYLPVVLPVVIIRYNDILNPEFTSYDSYHNSFVS